MGARTPTSFIAVGGGSGGELLGRTCPPFRFSESGSGNATLNLNNHDHSSKNNNNGQQFEVVSDDDGENIGKEKSYASLSAAFLEERLRPWQRRIFVGIYICYTCFYFTRKSFSFVLPALLTDPEFSLVTKEEVGLVGSVMGLTFAVGKVLLGTMADHVPPRLALLFTLLTCSLLNMLIPCFSSWYAFILLWGGNGFFQGGGWAPCSILLAEWYPRQSRGTWWGMTSTSQSVGASLVAVLCASISQ